MPQENHKAQQLSPWKLSSLNFSRRSQRSKTLAKFLLLSLAVHLIIGFLLGNFVIWQHFTRPEPTFEAPQIIEKPSIEQPVKIKISKSSEAKPKFNTRVITASLENMDIPQLDAPKINPRVGVSYGSGRYDGDGLGLGTLISKPSVSFFGTKTEGGDIIFVVDISGSMVQEPRGINGFKEVAKEVEKSLLNFAGQGRFNIVAFSGGVNAFYNGLTDATDKKVKKAVDWLHELDPASAVNEAGGNVSSVNWNAYQDGRHAGTRADIALKKAFSQRPDVIFFLSDGEPTKLSPEEVLALVEDLQKKQVPVVINTVSFKSSQGRDFLKRLAEENSGKFKSVN